MRAWLLVLLLASPLAAGCVENGSYTAEAASERGGMLVCAHSPCAAQAAAGFQVEPWVAIDPRDPDVAIVATFGRIREWGSWVYVARTEDGGATWTTTRAPAVADDPLAPADAPDAFPVRQSPVFVDHRPIAADTMAAFTLEGEALVVSLVGRNTYAYTPAASAAARPMDIVLWRSVDGGRTFGPGEVVVPAEGAVAFTGASRVDVNRWNDKPFLVTDSVTGEIHLFWNVVMRGSPQVQTLVAHSRDGGDSWTKPALVANGLYGVSAAAHNGTLLVTARNPGYQLLRSVDAGRTWERLGKVGDWPGPTGTWQAAPVALWQNGSAVEALLVRAEGAGGERVVLQRSADLGTTWSAPADLMPRNKSEKRNPVLALDPATGRGFVAAYQGADAQGAMLETWVAPLDAGAPQPAFKVSTRAARADSVYEYFGGAASPTGGIVAYASPGTDGAPLHAAALRWT